MYVAFYKGRKRLFNRLVSWWLGGAYSHCELVFLHREDVKYSLCYSSSWMDGGVREKWIDLGSGNWDLIAIPDAPNARKWMDEHFADGYDLLGLLGHLWRRGDGRKDDFMCSEAVAAMLGWVEPWRFDPCNFAAALRSVHSEPSS